MRSIGVPGGVVMVPRGVRRARRRGLGLDVVHTGQHYDYELSRVFFDELGLPDPVASLEL